MPSVAWITGDWHEGHGPGGLAWNRCVLPARALHREAGWRTGVFRTFLIDNDGTILPADAPTVMGGKIGKRVHSDGWDVIVFQRWMDADAPELIANAVRAGQCVGNDLDDWLHGARSWNPWQASVRADERSAGSNARHYDRALKAGVFLLCSTPDLAARMAGRVPGRVAVAHNMIDLDYWGEEHAAAQWPPRTVGWVGSTPYHQGDVKAMRGILDPILRRHDLRFVHAGGRAHEPLFADLAGLSVPVERRDPAPLSLGRYRRLFDGIDIAISPLEDFAFNDCKSWLKLSEYCAAGIPAVVSDAAAYREFGHPMRAGSAKQWRDWLELLITDRRAWKELRAWQTMRVRSLDYRTAYTEWEAVLAGLGADLGHVALPGR